MQPSAQGMWCMAGRCDCFTEGALLFFVRAGVCVCVVYMQRVHVGVWLCHCVCSLHVCWYTSCM